MHINLLSQERFRVHRDSSKQLLSWRLWGKNDNAKNNYSRLSLKSVVMGQDNVSIEIKKVNIGTRHFYCLLTIGI